MKACDRERNLVAPFTGAWIEIVIYHTTVGDNPQSHPSRVRGLKYLEHVSKTYDGHVAPFTGAWIEIQKADYLEGAAVKSHPSRVRGLK